MTGWSLANWASLQVYISCGNFTAQGKVGEHGRP